MCGSNVMMTSRTYVCVCVCTLKDSKTPTSPDGNRTYDVCREKPLEKKEENNNFVSKRIGW